MFQHNSKGVNNKNISVRRKNIRRVVRIVKPASLVYSEAWCFCYFLITTSIGDLSMSVDNNQLIS